MGPDFETTMILVDRLDGLRDHTRFHRIGEQPLDLVLQEGTVSFQGQAVVAAFFDDLLGDRRLAAPHAEGVLCTGASMVTMAPLR